MPSLLRLVSNPCPKLENSSKGFLTHQEWLRERPLNRKKFDEAVGIPFHPPLKRSVIQNNAEKRIPRICFQYNKVYTRTTWAAEYKYSWSCSNMGKRFKKKIAISRSKSLVRISFDIILLLLLLLYDLLTSNHCDLSERSQRFRYPDFYNFKGRRNNIEFDERKFRTDPFSTGNSDRPG